MMVSRVSQIKRIRSSASISVPMHRGEKTRTNALRMEDSVSKCLVPFAVDQGDCKRVFAHLCQATMANETCDRN